MILNGYIECAQTIWLHMYVKLFNKNFDSCVMLYKWLVCMIVPKYMNKGDTHDINNYRGITLLSCLSKLFTSVLNERCTEYSNTINLSNETIDGYKHKYSTLDHIFFT